MPLLQDILSQSMRNQKRPGLGGFYGQNIDQFGNEIGLSSGYADQIKKALDEKFANQLAMSTQSANESAIAGGDFNPELSKYYATQGARQAQQGANIQGLQAGRSDELNRVNLMNQAFQSKLGQENLDLQRKMYEDSQNFDIGDIAGLVGSFTPLLLEDGGEVTSAKAKKILTDGSVKGHPLTDAQKRYFGWIAGGRKPRKMAGGGEVKGHHIGFKNLEEMLKAKGATNPGGLAHYIGVKKYGKAGFKALQHKAGGGEINSSDYFQAMYDGGIPGNEINSAPENTGDNTLIKAKTGEVIQSLPAVNLVGGDNLKLINEAGQMANSIFGNTGDMLANYTKQPNKGQQLGGAIAPLAGKFADFVGGLFGGGGAKAVGARPMADGGMVGNPEEDLKQAEQNVLNAGYQLKGLSQDHPDYQRKVQEYQNAVATYKGLLDQYNKNVTNQTQNPNVTVQPFEQPSGQGQQQQQPAQPAKQKIIIEKTGI